MFAIMLACTALLRKLVPQWAAAHSRPRPDFVTVNLLFSFLAGAAGGFTTAWAADFNALRVVLALAIIVLVLGAISALQVLVFGKEATRGNQPAWYQVMLVVISPLGVIAGGLLRLRAAGFL